MALSPTLGGGARLSVWVQEAGLGVTQELVSHSTLAKEHLVRSMGSGFKPGPASHYQETLGRSLHSFEPISLPEKGTGCSTSLRPHMHICTVNSAPTQAGGGACGQWLRLNPFPQTIQGGGEEWDGYLALSKYLPV